MLRFIYSRSLLSIIFIMAALLAVWGYLCARMRRLRWQWGKLVLAVASVALILYVTLLNREPGTTTVILCPFAALVAARQQPELYREMLMNVFLFFPLGLTLSGALPQRWHRWVRIGITTGFACLFSAGIECAQYRFALGMAETDDVICDTLGAFLGSASLLLAHAVEKRKERR